MKLLIEDVLSKVQKKVWRNIDYDFLSVDEDLVRRLCIANGVQVYHALRLTDSKNIYGFNYQTDVVHQGGNG